MDKIRSNWPCAMHMTSLPTLPSKKTESLNGASTFYQLDHIMLVVDSWCYITNGC